MKPAEWLSIEMPRQLVCVRKGHDPVFTMKCSIRLDDVAALGATHYLTSCKRCGKVFEAKVQPA